eukprot:10557669-Prorocentrum_lima.AAC.1
MGIVRCGVIGGLTVWGQYVFGWARLVGWYVREAFGSRCCRGITKCFLGVLGSVALVRLLQVAVCCPR